jgi:Na+/phosphate symporter
MKTPELSVLEAQKEIQAFSNRMQRMFGMVQELLNLSSSERSKEKNNEQDFNKLYSRIEKYEGISDNMELEIAKYLESVSDAHLSDETKAKIRAMLREVSELESIGDACFNMARTINRKYAAKADHFIEKQYSHLHQMMGLTDQALTQMNKLIINAVHFRLVLLVPCTLSDPCLQSSFVIRICFEGCHLGQCVFLPLELYLSGGQKILIFSRQQVFFLHERDQFR